MNITVEQRADGFHIDIGPVTGTEEAVALKMFLEKVLTALAAAALPQTLGVSVSEQVATSDKVQ